jgi:hypothetical protein
MARLVQFIACLGLFTFMVANPFPAYGADTSTSMLHTDTMNTTDYPVKVYFSKHPDSDNDPTAVFSVDRTSPDLNVATFAIRQLIAGPTTDEQNAGFYTELKGAFSGTSSFCDGSDEFVLSLNQRGRITEQGTATLRFCRTLTLAGDLSGARITAEIKTTLLQFSTIKKVVILQSNWSCFGDLSGLNSCLVAPPREIEKVTLPETSIDGPALWGAQDWGLGPLLAVIAWTGTDTRHHLNVMYTTPNNQTPTGTNFIDKRTLPETSIARPAVTCIGPAAGSAVIVAWTGTDTRHRLNILFDVYGSNPQKLTLDETSITAPAITLFNGNLSLAWIGTDKGHHLNIMTIKLGASLKAGAKTTFWSYSSNVAPGLTTNTQPNQSQLLLTWTSQDPKHLIYYVSSKDGAKWDNPITPTTLAASSGGPNMLAITVTDPNPEIPSQMPNYFWAWTADDGSMSLNIEFTLTYPTWANAKLGRAALDEECLGGPALGYGGSFGSFWVVWTGVDSRHHLNVALVQV